MTDQDQEQEEYEDDRQHAGALTTQPRRDNQVARQDFAGSSLTTQNGAIEAMVAKARSEVEAACILAKRWPRNMDEVRQSILEECKRPGFALTAIYKIPRGDKTIEGLSIRFAEVALRAMGNLEASSETIYDDRAVRQVRVVVVDYERNSRYRKDITVNKTVERKFLKKGQRSLGERVNSYGDRVHIVEATEDDVTTKEASAISKAIRTGILRLVPGNLQDEARSMCKTIAAQADAKDPSAARNRMFDAFAAIGVKPIALEQWLGHTTDTISPAEVDELRQVHQAIKEGDVSWAEVLEERETERKTAAKAKPAAPAATAQPQPSTGAAPATDPPAPPAPAPAPREAPAPRPSSGKGTGALKNALKGKPPEEPTAGGQLFVAPTPQARRVATDLPPGTPAAEQGNEYRMCHGCDAIVEAPISAPPGTLCGDCSAAARE